MSRYAWVITDDHLVPPGGTGDERGTSGPRGVTDEQVNEAVLNGYLFKMYDDDGVLYYTGRIISTDMDNADIGCYAPLEDYGMPNAGCTAIRYPGHPEWDCS